MKIFVGFALVTSALAQTLSMTGPVNAKQSVPVTVNVNWSPGAVLATGLQWDLTGLPIGSTITIGGAGTTAAKSLTCKADLTRCIEIGMNQTVITAGQVASVSFPMPSQNVSLTLNGTVGTTATGTGIVVAGSTITIPFVRKEDLNSDGVVNVTDVNLLIQQALGNAACTADWNVDGKCNVIDIMIETLTALGVLP